MLICLWEGCKVVFEDATALQEHVITEHLQEQQQQLNMMNQKNAGKQKRETMPKNAITKQQEEKMINEKGIGRSKIPLMSDDVWFDVLGFITRIQLARSVSLTSRLIHKICWPRLHGNKVVPYEIGELTISVSSRERFDWSRPAEKVMLKDDGKEVQFPSCSPPAYITRFHKIKINYLDQEVLEFLSRVLICNRINPFVIWISLLPKNLDEKRRDSLKQLLNMLFTDRFPQTNLMVHHQANFEYMPNLDNKMGVIFLRVNNESDISIMMKILATPRLDGKQRVVVIMRDFLARKIRKAIKKEFHAATQPLLQPFFIRFWRTNFRKESVEKNQQTGETLTIALNMNYEHLDICRHPTGQRNKWLENARKRILENFTTFTIVSVNL